MEVLSRDESRPYGLQKESEFLAPQLNSNFRPPNQGWDKTWTTKR